MSLNKQVVLEALRLYREANHGGPLDNERRRRVVDQQIELLKEPITAQGIKAQGGAWKTELEEQLSWNMTPGIEVVPGEKLQFLRPISMKDMEDIAASVAAAALKEFVG